jgi:hypothetical protein
MTTQARELAKLVNNSGDVNLVDDITLGSDGALLNFGADSDVVITHVADTGLLLNSSRQLQFGDSGTYIHQSADGVLDLVSDTEIELNATTLDINANVDISGTLTVAGALDFGDAVLSNVGAVALDSISGDADANTSITFSGSDVITITTGGETQVTFNNGSILPTTDADIDLGSSSLQFKDAYFHGSVETDALTIGGVSIAETIADTVGAMVSSNTETNITVNYDDSDNTLDFVIGTLNQNTTGTAATVTGAAQTNITSVGTLTSLNTSGDVTMTSTDTGSSAGPIINLVRDSASPADADYLGQIKFKGENDNGASTVYSKITGKIDDASNGSEDGIIEFAAQKAGTSTILARLKSTALKLLDGTIFEGDLTGNVTGNVSGTAATVTTAAQTNITSVGTLTALDVDNINLNGNTLTTTSSDFIVDASHDIILDADGSNIFFKDATTTRFEFFLDSTPQIKATGGTLDLENLTQDAAIRINGNDGGSVITALRLEMSDAGKATFNGTVVSPLIDSAVVDGENFKINGAQGSDGQLMTSTGSGVAWEDAPASGPSKGLAIVLGMII